MRKRNWREYNKKLVQRGSLTFLIDPKVMKTLEVKQEMPTSRLYDSKSIDIRSAHPSLTKHH